MKLLGRDGSAGQRCAHSLNFLGVWGVEEEAGQEAAQLSHSGHGLFKHGCTRGRRLSRGDVALSLRLHEFFSGVCLLPGILTWDPGEPWGFRSGAST